MRFNIFEGFFQRGGTIIFSGNVGMTKPSPNYTYPYRTYSPENMEKYYALTAYWGNYVSSSTNFFESSFVLTGSVVGISSRGY
jgi:hypothetical protein